MRNPRNPARRTALLDAAVDVLARDGARGLTFRRIDQAAGVPTGTTTNYFPGRDELLHQVGEHVFQRLAPDADHLATLMARPASQALDIELMHDLMARVAADRNGYLALLELRLEATRRPQLRDAFTATVRSDLEASTAFHLDAGLPGDASTVLVLYLAMTGLIVESLTLPGVLAGRGVTELTDVIVRTVVPDVAG